MSGDRPKAGSQSLPARLCAEAAKCREDFLRVTRDGNASTAVVGDLARGEQVVATNHRLPQRAIRSYVTNMPRCPHLPARVSHLHGAWESLRFEALKGRLGSRPEGSTLLIFAPTPCLLVRVDLLLVKLLRARHSTTRAYRPVSADRSDLAPERHRPKLYARRCCSSIAAGASALVVCTTPRPNCEDVNEALAAIEHKQHAPIADTEPPCSLYPSNLRTSPSGKRSIAAAMRSRSGRDNRFSDLSAAGRISIRHDVSVSEFRLRLGPSDRPLGARSFDGCPVLICHWLVVELNRVESREHGVLCAPEKDRRSIKRLLRKGVTLKKVPSPVGARSLRGAHEVLP